MQENSALDLQDVRRVPRETLQAQVYGQLRQLLMTGRFHPGQALKIRDIAQSFGTSVQPVREAIRQLMAEQALEASPNASTRIPRLNREQLEDLRGVRLAVEGLAVERAAARIGVKELAELTKIVSAEIAADDAHRVEASVARNLEFHFRLYSYSGSAILPSIIEGLWLRVGPSIRDAAEAFDARGGKGGMHHLDMLKALRKNDVAGMRRAVEDDINRFFDLVLRKYDQAASANIGARPTGKRAGKVKAGGAPRAQG